MFRIGLDVGGVLLDSLSNEGTPTDIFGDDYLRATAVAGAFEGTGLLVEYFGHDNVFVLSKARREVTRTRVMEWLQYNGFFRITGLRQENVHFCNDWIDKTPLAAQLGLTAFVDDKCDVLKCMQVVVPRRFLFGPQPTEDQDASGLILVNDWRHLMNKIDRIRAGRPV